MIARLLACAAVAVALAAAIAAERVRANASELASSLGPALLAYAGASHDDGHRTLLVNGATLQMRTGMTNDPIDTVLDRQRQACGPTHVLMPLVRWSSEIEGLLGCVVMADGASLFEQLRALDEIRVTWVRASGGARRYVVIASRDALAVSQMFPAQGDAPGADVPELPRPPGARRVLTALQPGAEPMLVAYRSERSLDVFEQEYRAALAKHERSVESVAPLEQGRGKALLVHRGAFAHLVLLDREEEGTLAVIIPLPTQPAD